MSTSLESTVRGMNDWWYKNFGTVVRWIDDRNEAARLGVTVEELLIARQVEAVLNPPSDVGHIRFGFDLDIPNPRKHHQIVKITS